MAKRESILDRAIAASGPRHRTWFDSIPEPEQRELLKVRKEYHAKGRPCSVQSLLDECVKAGIPLKIQRCQFDRWLKEGCDGKRG